MNIWIQTLTVRAWGVPDRPPRRPLTHEEKVERWGYHGEEA